MEKKFLLVSKSEQLHNEMQEQLQTVDWRFATGFMRQLDDSTLVGKDPGSHIMHFELSDYAVVVIDALCPSNTMWNLKAAELFLAKGARVFWYGYVSLERPLPKGIDVIESSDWKEKLEEVISDLDETALTA